MTRTPHKHAAIIKAWADGAEIEFFSLFINQWITANNDTPIWRPDLDYRIKPEPKPDVVVEWLVKEHKVTYFDNRSVDAEKNLRLTFDGETGKLKSAGVLK